MLWKEMMAHIIYVYFLEHLNLVFEHSMAWGKGHLIEG